MADQKITELDAVASLATSDLFVMVDVDDDAMSESGTNKSITTEDLFHSVPAGTVEAPGLAFAGDSDTGLVGLGANTLGIAAGGVVGVQVTNTAGVVTTRITQAGTSSPSLSVMAAEESGQGDHILTVEHPTRGVISYVNGAGQQRWYVHDSNGSLRGDIWYTTPGANPGIRITSGTGSADIFVAGSTPVLALGSNSSRLIQLRPSDSKLGFFNTSPIERPVIGDAATDEASAITLANNIRTALINLGLCSAS